MIRVINKRTATVRLPEVAVNVMRPSVLGNPYRAVVESQRDVVVDKFDKYLRHKMLGTNPVRAEVLRIVAMVAKGQSVALQCCCYPKRCHAEVIKTIIEEELLKGTP